MKIVYFVLVFYFVLFNWNNNLTAKPDWKVNPASFEYSMTMTAVGIISCEYLEGRNDMIAAFIDEKICGVQSFTWTTSLHKVAYLTIYSNQISGSTVKFKLYKSSTDQIVDVSQEILFQENANAGNDKNPVIIGFDETSGAILQSRNNLKAFWSVGDTITDLHLISSKGDTLEGTWCFLDEWPRDIFSWANNYLVLKNTDWIKSGDTLTFRIGVKYKNACEYVDSITLIVSDLTVNDDVMKSDLNIYPNPIVNGIDVSISGIDKIKQVLLMDPLGRKLELKVEEKGDGLHEVKMPDRISMPGIYCIVIESNMNELISRKLILD